MIGDRERGTLQYDPRLVQVWSIFFVLVLPRFFFLGRELSSHIVTMFFYFLVWGGWSDIFWWIENLRERERESTHIHVGLVTLVWDVIDKHTFEIKLYILYMIEKITNLK